MNRRFGLSELQGAAVQSALDRLSARATRRLSLSGLMNEWQSFVAEIERGYKDSIYEYTNSLGSREVLDELCRSVPKAVAKVIELALRPIDDRYESATKPTTKSIISGAGDRSARWYRIPRILLDGLRADLESESE
jgi:hypothetical protein